jgi:hypothetical protein
MLLFDSTTPANLSGNMDNITPSSEFWEEVSESVFSLATGQFWRSGGKLYRKKPAVAYQPTDELAALRAENARQAAELAAKDAALRAHHAWHLENEKHDAYSDSGLCEQTLSVLNVNPDPGWLSPEEAAKLREQLAMAIRDREYVIKCKDELTRELAIAREDSARLDWLDTSEYRVVRNQPNIRVAIDAARNAGGVA